jgi:hypothetical protein
MQSCLAVEGTIRLWGAVVRPDTPHCITVPEHTQLWLRSACLGPEPPATSAGVAGAPDGTSSVLSMSTDGEPATAIARLALASRSGCRKLNLEISAGTEVRLEVAGPSAIHMAGHLVAPSGQDNLGQTGSSASSTGGELESSSSGEEWDDEVADDEVAPAWMERDGAQAVAGTNAPRTWLT